MLSSHAHLIFVPFYFSEMDNLFSFGKFDITPKGECFSGYAGKIKTNLVICWCCVPKLVYTDSEAIWHVLRKQSAYVTYSSKTSFAVCMKHLGIDFVCARHC